jgi:hypothetical protein
LIACRLVQALGVLIEGWIIMRINKHLIILGVMVIVQASVSYAQTSEARRVKSAAQAFYRMHVAHFGFPLEPDLKRLRPYLSPELNSLLANELRRMREWSLKNPDMKPPVMEDLFICNRYEKPQRFRIVEARPMGRRALVRAKFEYLENGQVIDSCEVEGTFIRLKGKWLLDNVDWDETPDLRTLLSRKDYALVPG